MSILRTDGCYERRDPSTGRREYVAISRDAGGDYWFIRVFQVWERAIGEGSPREWLPAYRLRCRDEAEARRMLERYATDPSFCHSSEFPESPSGW